MLLRSKSLGQVNERLPNDKYLPFNNLHVKNSTFLVPFI